MIWDRYTLRYTQNYVRPAQASWNTYRNIRVCRQIESDKFHNERRHRLQLTNTWYQERKKCQRKNIQEHVSLSLETFAASNITACLPESRFLWSCSTLCSIYGLKTYDWYVRFALSLPIIKQLEMWANAQRDGRPAEYRWRSLFNAAKCGWRPVLECRAVRLASGARMANFGRFSGPEFPASRMQHISGLHSKFALGPHHM